MNHKCTKIKRWIERGLSISVFVNDLLFKPELMNFWSPAVVLAHCLLTGEVLSFSHIRIRPAMQAVQFSADLCSYRLPVQLSREDFCTASQQTSEIPSFPLLVHSVTTLFSSVLCGHLSNEWSCCALGTHHRSTNAPHSVTVPGWGLCGTLHPDRRPTPCHAVQGTQLLKGREILSTALFLQAPLQVAF